MWNYGNWELWELRIMELGIVRTDGNWELWNEEIDHDNSSNNSYLLTF